MFVGKRFCTSLCTALFFLLSHQVSAQIVAGFSVNGKTVARGDTVNVCQGNTLQYRGTGSGSLNISWRFQNGSQTTGTGIGPWRVTYNSPGIDSVVQTMWADGDTVMTWCFIRVSNKKPTAAYTWSPDADCGNVPVQFVNSSTGDQLTYSWDFGDGGTSTQLSPSYSFLNAIGTSGSTMYNVALTVTNSLACTASVTHAVTIKKTPDASLASADADVILSTFNGIATFRKCSNTPFYTFSFANASTTTSINTGFTIQWGDGSPDSSFTSWPAGVVVKHTFPLGGSTMIVKVTGSTGCVGIKTFTVFLGSTPAGGLASLGNTDICGSDSLRFAINNTEGNPPGTLYTFLINDNTPAQVFTSTPPATVGHYFANGSCGFASSSGNNTYDNAFGAYLTIENPCGTTSPSVVPIYVSGKPQAGIYVYPAAPICTGNPIWIDNISAYGAIISPTGGGNSTCTNKGKQVWTITPSTGFTLTSGSLGSLNGNPTNGALWTSGDNNLHAIFNTPGTYTAKIYIYNNRCGMDSTTYNICVRNPPSASFTLPTHRQCGPGTIALNNTSPLATCSGDQYTWTVTYLDPQGCSDVQGPAYSYTGGTDSTRYSPSLKLNAPGRYIIQLKVASTAWNSPCSPSVAQDTITVVGAPKANIIVPEAMCPSAPYQATARIDSCYSPGPFQYQWQFNGGTPASSTTLSPGAINYATIGTYTVSLTVTDGTCNTTGNASAQLKVITAPIPDAGPDTSICTGTPLKLGVAGVDGVIYHWRPANALSDTAIANPAFTGVYTGPSADTTYQYILDVSLNGACASSDTVWVKVKRSPHTIISPATRAICIGDSLQLTASGADSYTWTPAPSSTIGASVTLRPATTTPWTIVGSLAGCTDTSSILITVRPDAKAAFAASSTTVCSSSSLAQLITVTRDTVPGARYTWKDNGVVIGSDTSSLFPNWSLASPGSTDTIRLVVSSPYGCKSDSSQTVFHSIPGIQAHFTKSGTAACGPLRIYFTNDTGTPASAQFFWDFGNGSGSALTQPDSITFTSSPYFRDTTYRISLKAYNGCDTTIWKDSVTVYADPHAAFTVSSVLGCSPFTDTLINLSPASNSSYHWDFGDGMDLSTTSTNNITHKWAVGVIDTFTVVLTAQNRCGLSMDSLDIVVTPTTIRPAILLSGNSTAGCVPFTAKFNNSSAGAAQIAVDFQDGSAQTIVPGTQSVISHQYTQPGTYNVRMRLTNACSDTTITRTVVVYPGPVAAFSVSPNPVCTGNAVTATNLSANANSYRWTWGDSSSSDATNSTHIYTAGGSYPVRLTASLVNQYGTVCSVTSDSIMVSVVDLIQAQIDTGGAKPCIPYNLTVNARNAAGAKSVVWTFYDAARTGGSFMTSGVSASYQYNTPGTYRIKLVVENAGGCKDSTIYGFIVYAGPKLNAPNIGTVYTCNTDTTLLLNSGVNYSGTDALSWSWAVNGSSAGLGNPVEYRFQLPDNANAPVNFAIAVQVADNQGCTDSAGIGTLVIRPLIKPVILVSPDTILYQPYYTFTFADQVSHYDGQRYVWDPGDKNGWSYQSQMTHTYGDTGAYHVSVQVTDATTGCSRGDTTQVRIIGVPGYLYVPDAICPGCAVGELRSFLPKGRGLKEYHLRIYNAWGQLIFESTRLDADGAPSEPWNARYNGQSVQQDSYRWQIEAKYINGTEWKGMLYPNKSTPVKSSFITVVR